MQNSRTQRQIKILNNWKKIGCRGTVVAATGFGKTRTALMACRGLIKRYGISSIVVIVPSIGLKEQWEKHINVNNLQAITKVFVINTAAAMHTELDCDFIIYDEFHRAGSEFFGQVRAINYKYALALTATIERTDGAHTEMLDELPICDEVSIEECLDNGWISNYIILNLMVPFTIEDEELYHQYTKAFNQAAVECTTDDENGFVNAKKWVRSKVWDERKKASTFFQTLSLKNSLFKNNPQKIKAATYLVNKLLVDKKGFIFGNSIEVAKELQIHIEDASVLFHSKIGKKAKAKAMTQFLNDIKRIMNAVASLNEGIDVPDCDLGIVLAGSSSKREARQQLGRVIRATDDSTKKAIFINLCTPNTTEESWARKKFDGLKYINIWKDDLEQLI
jgi:superfamily II DNA or RNA helicase